MTNEEDYEMVSLKDKPEGSQRLSQDGPPNTKPFLADKVPLEITTRVVFRTLEATLDE